MMIANKGSEFSLSNGDERRRGGRGQIEHVHEGVDVDPVLLRREDGGQGRCRLTDKKFQNHENTVDLAGEFQFPQLVGMPDEESCQNCKRAREEEGTESYEDFFTKEDREEFDQIAKDFPDSANMLPPKNGRYRAVSAGARTSARKAYKKAREKVKKAGGDIDNVKMDHPHPIAYGGCPIHQTMATAETAADEAADKRKNAVMDKVNARKGIS